MQPIGINFLPSDAQAANGPRQGNLEGDLGQAFKILSLRLPRRPSIGGIAPQALLESPGGTTAGGGMNPLAAVFEALLRGIRPLPGAPGLPPPHIIPGNTGGGVMLPGSGAPPPLVPGGVVGPPGGTPSGPSIPGRTPGTVFKRGSGY